MDEYWVKFFKNVKYTFKFVWFIIQVIITILVIDFIFF